MTVRVERWCDRSIQKPQIEALKSFSFSVVLALVSILVSVSVLVSVQWRVVKREKQNTESGLWIELHPHHQMEQSQRAERGGCG